MDTNYILYPDCKLVKGITKSAIYDLTRSKILFIPNTLYEILYEYNGFPYNKLKNIYTETEDEDTLGEYLTFLMDHDFLYKSSDMSTFKDIPNHYKSSALISNIIIDSKEDSKHNYKTLISEIKKVQCSSILLRFYFSIDIEKLIEILSHFVPPTILDIKIMLPFCNKTKSDEVKSRIHNLNILITEIIFSDSPYNKTSIFNGIQIEYIKRKIIDATHCGCIGIKNFSVNIRMYTESKNYNNCLYKKIAIDCNGNIKNCPSCSLSYGKLGQVSFLEIIENPNFKKLWYIKKDDIEECKDCIFRYACLDCRIYRTDNNNIYSKPLKCNYNPYEEDDT